MRRRGFLMFDVVMALFILVVMMTLFSVGMHARQKAAVKLKDTRSASSAVEAVLCDLQQGRAPAHDQTVERVKIERMAGGTKVPGCTWVRVTAIVNGHSESLIGLARSIAVKEGAR